MPHIFQAPAGKANVMGVFLRASNDPGLVIGRQAHGLCLVELGILETGDAQHSIPKSRSQTISPNVDLVAEDQFQRARKLADNWRLLSTT